MLLSLQELIVFTGLGPFEVALHAFALLLFTLLTTLRLEGVVAASWHAIFAPLYVALGLHAYHAALVSLRMVALATRYSSKRILLVISVLSAVGLGLLIFLEYSTASYLDGTASASGLVTSLILLGLYLSVRVIFLYRALTKPSFSF